MTKKQNIGHQHKACRLHLPSLLVGGLLLSYVSGFQCHTLTKKFRQDLSSADRNELDRIAKARCRTLIRGFIYSFLISVIYAWICHMDGHYSRHTIDVLFWFLFIPFLYYLWTPQPEYLLVNNLHGRRHVTEWFRVYSCYKRSMIKGFVMGVLLTALFLWVIPFKLN